MCLYSVFDYGVFVHHVFVYRVFVYSVFNSTVCLQAEALWCWDLIKIWA